LASLRAEYRHDLVRNLDSLLAETSGELIGFELLEDFLERQIHQGMVAV
jgi:hypothetical protein